MRLVAVARSPRRFEEPRLACWFALVDVFEDSRLERMDYWLSFFIHRSHTDVINNLSS